MAVYLVTGVAGFIGAAVAGRLVSQGHKVVGMDNLSTGFLDHVPSGVEFYEIGIENPEIFDILKKYKFDAIFHIAGQSGGELSYSDPVYDLQANSQSTLLLLKYASENDCKKVIFASTVSVYGEPENNLDISEDIEAIPKSFYGVGKLASEHYLRIYASQFGLDTIALRLFNIYGPGQNLDNFQQGMSSIYLSQAIRNKHIHVKGSKDRYRDLVYIDDTVDAFIEMLDQKVSGYNVYNVATGEKTHVVDIVNEIKNNLPFDITVEYEGSTPGDVFGYTGNPQKLISQTTWKPSMEVKEGIKNMVKWALEKELNI